MPNSTWHINVYVATLKGNAAFVAIEKIEIPENVTVTACDLLTAVGPDIRVVASGNVEDLAKYLEKLEKAPPENPVKSTKIGLSH